MLIPDSIIMIKKLPYLPDILPSSSSAYNIYVEDFMVRDVFYIWYGMTYSELKQALKQGRKLKGFPLVDNPDHMVLLGSIKRSELIALIQKQGGDSIDIKGQVLCRVTEKNYENLLLTSIWDVPPSCPGSS